jgi:hypothetical protein
MDGLWNSVSARYLAAVLQMHTITSGQATSFLSTKRRGFLRAFSFLKPGYLCKFLLTVMALNVKNFFSTVRCTALFKCNHLKKRDFS